MLSTKLQPKCLIRLACLEAIRSKIYIFFTGVCDNNAVLNRPFPHSNKQWHRVEVGVDKNTANV